MFRLFLNLFLLTLIPTHKFYLSISDIRYSENSKTLQIACKIFTDDIENAIKVENNTYLNLFSAEENKKSDSLLFFYIKDKLKLFNRNKKIALHWIGKEQEADAIWIYVETDSLANFDSLVIENTILISVFEEQQNIINFYYMKNRQSFIFDAENEKQRFELR